MMNLLERLLFAIRVVILRRNYAADLRRLRMTVGKRKFKVAFFVSELAKWKGQRVFDRMRASELFEPLIVVMPRTDHFRLPLDWQIQMEDEKLRYFQSRRIPVVDIQRSGKTGTLDIDDLGADIVFYQQPWCLLRQMKPLAVSKRALTFYFPYYVPNYSDVEIEIGHKLHHFLYGHIVCNERMAEFFRRVRRCMPGAYGGKLLPLGHPSLDAIPFSESGGPDDGCVIYAPHWTIEYGEMSPELKYSTFLENGRFILDYAKHHRELKWAFKPHPALRAALVRSGAMTRLEADTYYHEWEEIGEACYSGPDDYIELFGRSRAMITDCGSFLTEYGCTGKPIIRLVNPKLNADTQPMVRDLYSTYYNVHGRDRLQSVLDEVVVGRRDPMRDKRLAALKEANLTGHDAAGAIVKYLEDLVRGVRGT